MRNTGLRIKITYASITARVHRPAIPLSKSEPDRICAAAQQLVYLCEQKLKAINTKIDGFKFTLLKNTFVKTEYRRQD
jgi:hypothetical protein